MSWLLREEDVLAALEQRRRGWKSSLQGAVILRRPALVQTLSPAVDLDVAWCVPAPSEGDREAYLVKHISTVPSRRCTMPRLTAGVLLVAPAGSFERWQLSVGDCLEIKVT